MARLILFLVRLKLGVRKNERFRFTNQKADCCYEVSGDGVWKIWGDDGCVNKRNSRVSINWLLGPDCKIEKI